MKQRVVIAIAISLRAKVIIADEPTSALDVVVQRQVIETLRRVQEKIGASIMLVGHDMGLMAQVVDRLGVMYAGRLVEVCAVDEIFREPLHPYSQLLIASLPTLDHQGAFQGIPGLTPSLLDRPRGCSFPLALSACDGPLRSRSAGHARGSTRSLRRLPPLRVGGARVGDANRDRGMRCPPCSRPARSQSFSAEGCAGGG